MNRVFILVLLFGKLFAENVGKSTVVENANRGGGGFAIHIGMGSLYGGDGGATIEYQVMIRPKARLTPFVSAGSISTYGEEAPLYGFGYCLGINVEFGKFQRFFVGPSFGTHTIDCKTDSINPRYHYDLNTIIAHL